MCGGILQTGVPTEAELRHAPGIPASAEIKPGGTAWIECLQTIACNPCEANCPVGAIRIGPKIASLPRLDPEKCIGCGTCADICNSHIFVHDRAVDRVPQVRFPDECWHCDSCVIDCPKGAIALRIPLPCTLLHVNAATLHAKEHRQ